MLFHSTISSRPIIYNFVFTFSSWPFKYNIVFTFSSRPFNLIITSFSPFLADYLNIISFYLYRNRVGDFRIIVGDELPDGFHAIIFDLKSKSNQIEHNRSVLKFNSLKTTSSLLFKKLITWTINNCISQGFPTCGTRTTSGTRRCPRWYAKSQKFWFLT